MFTWNQCHGSLSTPDKNEIIALLSLMLTLNIWRLVFLLLILDMYLFSGFDVLIIQSFLD